MEFITVDAHEGDMLYSGFEGLGALLFPSKVFDHIFRFVNLGGCEADCFLYGDCTFKCMVETRDLVDFGTFVQRFGGGILGTFVSVGRFIIAALFMLSFLLRPLEGPILTLWARLIESDKPVFTLLFGALGALITAIQEIVSHV